MKKLGVFFVAVPYLAFLHPNSALANCEAGASYIHTVATYYNDQTAKLLIKPFAKRENAIFISNPDPSTDPGIEEKPGMKFSLRNTSCFPKKYRTVSRPLDPNQEQPNDEDLNTFKIDFEGCGKIVDSIPQAGYVVFDKSKNEIKIPTPLKVHEYKIEPTLKKDLEGKIRREISRLKIVASRSVDDDQNGGGITPDVILGYDFTYVSAGEASSELVMITATLKLKNVDQLFWIDQTSTTNEQREKLKAALADFPVIYFYNRQMGLMYVADGSNCAATTVYYSIHQEDSGSKPGSKKKTPNHRINIHEFKLTNAYSIRDDGTPDILEIDNTYAYYFDKANKKLLVISNGQPGD